MVVRWFTPGIMHNVSKTLLSSCGPFSVSRKPGIPCSMTHWSEKIEKACSARVFDDRMARARFVHLSVISTMNWFSFVVFWQRAQSVYCVEFQGPAGREQFRMALPLQARSIYCTFTAVAGCRVRVVCALLPVDTTSHSVVHATLAGVSCWIWIMFQVEKACLEGVWYRGLSGPVEWGNTN